MYQEKPLLAQFRYIWPKFQKSDAGEVGLHEGALLTLIRLPPQKLCTASEVRDDVSGIAGIAGSGGLCSCPDRTDEDGTARIFELQTGKTLCVLGGWRKLQSVGGHNFMKSILSLQSIEPEMYSLASIGILLIPATCTVHVVCVVHSCKALRGCHLCDLLRRWGAGAHNDCNPLDRSL